jgi:hypothetical protein
MKNAWRKFSFLNGIRTHSLSLSGRLLYHVATDWPYAMLAAAFACFAGCWMLQARAARHATLFTLMMSNKRTVGILAIYLEKEASRGLTSVRGTIGARGREDPEDFRKDSCWVTGTGSTRGGSATSLRGKSSVSYTRMGTTASKRERGTRGFRDELQGEPWLDPRGLRGE